MIELQNLNGKNLNIILANTNRALNKVLNDLAPKELATFTQGKDLGSLFESLLKNNPQESMQNKELLQALKTNPSLKPLLDVTTTLKEFQTATANEKSLPTLQKLKSAINDIVQNRPTSDEKVLKTKLENSGVFLESKLKHFTPAKENIKPFANDIKALLHQSLQELQKSTIPDKGHISAQLDKLNIQIDYYQLLSHLSYASAIYLPYSFEGLEDGHITLKSAKNNSFFCDIELQLKEYGALNLRLGLFEENQLSINIESQSQELTEKLKSNLPTLRKNLSGAGLHTKDIRFIEKNEQHKYYQKREDLALGFEVNV